MMSFFKKRKKKKYQRLDDLEIDTDSAIIDLDLPEINDVQEDQFGIPVSRLYISREPDFDKAEKEGLEAYKKLSKYFNYHPRNV